jgi:hypothetical protein
MLVDPLVPAVKAAVRNMREDTNEQGSDKRSDERYG